MDVILFLSIPIGMYLIFYGVWLAAPEDTDYYKMQTGRIAVLLHVILLYVWTYHLGNDIFDVAAKSSKATNQAYQLRNVIFTVVLVAWLIYRLYMLFAMTYVWNGHGDFAREFFNAIDMGFLAVCFLMYMLNANSISKDAARIIKPRMRLIYFLAMLVYPIGVFYLQPKFNKIKTRKKDR